MIHPIRVTTENQALWMARIRNSGTEGFANHQKKISNAEQSAWWKMNRSSIKAWLFYTTFDVSPQPIRAIGFGMIRNVDGIRVPSAGVWPEFRGMGYGKEIVSFLAREARRMRIPLHAQALKSNPAAIRTHVPELWEQVREDEQFVYFQSKVPQ